jgi:hypothetical protein
MVLQECEGTGSSDVTATNDGDACAVGGHGSLSQIPKMGIPLTLRQQKHLATGIPAPYKWQIPKENFLQ